MNMAFGFVAIARNEGERLRRCLLKLKACAAPVVYVDSGSTDGSVEFARSLGMTVHELDMSRPFNMPRARNEGFRKLLDLNPGLDFVHFLDGDCELVDGWMDQALKTMADKPKAAAVCGRRRERYPEASVYNRLCDIEWNTPVGLAKSCGGDALMRVRAFNEAGGFDEALIAGEEPELCLRLRKAGWEIWRIDADMTLHDAAIHRFAQWWKRMVRGGYGSMDVLRRCQVKFPDEEPPFQSMVKSTRFWMLAVPGLALLAALTTPFTGWYGAAAAGLLLLALPAQALRMAWAARVRCGGFRPALAYGMLTMIGKAAQVRGQFRYLSDLRKGKAARLIEYKA